MGTKMCMAGLVCVDHFSLQLRQLNDMLYVRSAKRFVVPLTFKLSQRSFLVISILALGLES